MPTVSSGNFSFSLFLLCFNLYSFFCTVLQLLLLSLSHGMHLLQLSWPKLRWLLSLLPHALPLTQHASAAMLMFQAKTLFLVLRLLIFSSICICLQVQISKLRWLHCCQGVDMAKLGDDRHRLFCKIADVLCAHRVQYTFPGFGSFQRYAVHAVLTAYFVEMCTQSSTDVSCLYCYHAVQPLCKIGS